MLTTSLAPGHHVVLLDVPLSVRHVPIFLLHQFQKFWKLDCAAAIRYILH